MKKLLILVILGGLAGIVWATGPILLHKDPALQREFQNVYDELRKMGTVLTTGKLIVSVAHTPASSSEACTTGTVSWDTSFIYVCISSNTWKRIALSSF